VGGGSVQCDPPMSEPLHLTKTAEAQAEDRLAPIPRRAFLFVVLHSDKPSLGGARYDLSTLDEVVIGRGESRQASRDTSNDVPRLTLSLPSATMSKSHARLVREGDVWFIEDAGSRNGCFIQGKRITRARLQDGDFIEIGSVLLRFRADLPTPPGSEGDVDSALSTPEAPGLSTLLPPLAKDLDALARIAKLPIATLLLGETGTGKEVLAKSIHSLSGRSGPFVGVNCGALTASLLESQLFGHVKGSFTGALRDEPGFVRSADGGTLFLDEIGDLPLPAQAALLRVLQEREVIAVGSTRPVKVDVRVVAATHKMLDYLCVTGQFRSDLLARLSGYRHVLTPLRDRIEDLGLLLAVLLARENASDTRVSVAMGRRLCEYGWPLNIRELAQVLTTALALAEGAPLDVHHFPDAIANAQTTPSRPPTEPPEKASPPERPNPDDLRGELVALLEKHRGNITEVAKTMGKTRMQIHRWMQRFGVDPNTYRG